MPKEKESVKVKRWVARIQSANKAFEKWAQDYKVARCRRYWKGFQRSGDEMLDRKGNERVQVNLILPTVGIKIPSLYFYYPFARISGSPAESDTPSETIDDRAQLLQDMANTIVREPSTGFRWETLLALKDSMWALGVVEIGYSAEFTDNPSFKRPPLAEDEKIKKEMGKEAAQPDSVAPGLGPLGAGPVPAPAPGLNLAGPLGSSGGNPMPPTPPIPGGPPMPGGPPSPDEQTTLSSLKQIVQEETFFVRRIPPDTFRCSINSKPTLLHNDWIGYYEWMYVEDVKDAPAYKGNTKGLKPSGKISAEYGSAEYTQGMGPETGELDADDRLGARERSGMIQVWKIWSLREKMRYVIAEGHDKFLLKEPYKVLPLYPIRFEILPDDFYPIPPISQMLGPQDEYNDSREMLRGLRKTIYPRNLVKDGAIEQGEVAKLEEGGPNVYAWCTDPAAVTPVQQPSWDSAIIRTLAVSKDDLLQTSGISSEMRGQAESDTATQAVIVNQRSLVRESFGRLQVAEWLGQIISGLLRLAIQKMTLPMWILKNADPFSPSFPMEATKIAQAYRPITYTDIEEADNLIRWDVNVDIETLSPLTEQTARAEWGQMLSMISNPAVAMLLSRSKVLLKRTLDTFGIRSGRDQEAIAEALGMLAQAAATPPGMPGTPSPPNPAGPGGKAMAGPPGGPPEAPRNTPAPPPNVAPPAAGPPGGGAPAPTH